MSIVELPPGLRPESANMRGRKPSGAARCYPSEAGEDVETLEAGDSFTWNAIVPHEVTNIGEDPAVVLIAVSKELELDHLLNQ